MKFRTGFVTNSSSTSYILLAPMKSPNEEDLMDLIRKSIYYKELSNDLQALGYDNMGQLMKDIKDDIYKHLQDSKDKGKGFMDSYDNPLFNVCEDVLKQLSEKITSIDSSSEGDDAVVLIGRKRIINMLTPKEKLEGIIINDMEG